MTVQNAFEVRHSAGNAQQFEIADTLNKTTWGPFADTESTQCQIAKLENLEELRQIQGRIGDLERTIWEEITLESESGAKARKLGDDMMAIVEKQLTALQQEQKQRTF